MTDYEQEEVVDNDYLFLILQRGEGGNRVVGHKNNIRESLRNRAIRVARGIAPESMVYFVSNTEISDIAHTISPKVPKLWNNASLLLLCDELRQYTDAKNVVVLFDDVYYLDNLRGMTDGLIESYLVYGHRGASPKSGNKSGADIGIIVNGEFGWKQFCNMLRRAETQIESPTLFIDNIHSDENYHYINSMMDRLDDENYPEWEKRYNIHMSAFGELR